MPFQFYCPQGHVLQSDESSVGQACQCPYCGAAFLVPAPMPGTGVQGREPPLQQFQPLGGLPGIPASPRPQFEMPGGGPSPGLPGASAAPDDLPHAVPLPVEPVAEGASAFELPPAKPFDLGFDVNEQEPLPFDFPGGPVSDSPTEESLPFDISGEQAAEATAAAVDSMLSEAAGEDETRDAALQATLDDTNIFHIPCPSGHVVTVTRAMLGKTAMCSLCRKRFVLRPEKSIEHQEMLAARHKRNDPRVGQYWLIGAITAAVVVLIILVIIAFATSGR
jgi:hypothetical protein